MMMAAICEAVSIRLNYSTDNNTENESDDDKDSFYNHTFVNLTSIVMAYATPNTEAITPHPTAELGSLF